MAKRRVLITGASGYIASQLLPSFREKYDLVLLDVTDRDRRGEKVRGVQVVDLIDPDRSKYLHYFQGVDSVVHLAYKHRAGEPIDQYFDEKQNVDMAYNVYRCAYDAGVRRVVMASSNHAADWYEHNLIHEHMMEVLDPYTLPLSDNFYGWSKATYEHLGFLFACGIFGRKLEVVLIRIGAPREIDVARFQDNPKEYKRDLGAHISQRDLCQLVTRAIETPRIDNEPGVPWEGVPWLVVYGISGNTRAFWSLTNARKVLGYHPEDDTEVKYAKDIFGFLTGPGGKGGVGKVGL